MSTNTGTPLVTPTTSPSPGASGRSSRHKHQSSHSKGGHSKSPILSRCLGRSTGSTSSSSIVSASSPTPPATATNTLALRVTQNKSDDQLHQPQLQQLATNAASTVEHVEATTSFNPATSTNKAQAGTTTTTTAASIFTAGRDYSYNETPPSPSSLRIKVAAVRKMASLWSHIKNSSPVKKAKMSSWISASSSSNNSPEVNRRSSHHSIFSIKGLRSKKDKLRRSGQYSYSHPDVSCGNLASLAFPGSSSRDDMALELITTTTCNEVATCSSATAVTTTAKIESFDTNQQNQQCMNNHQHHQAIPNKSVKSQIFSAFSRQTSKDVVSEMSFFLPSFHNYYSAINLILSLFLKKDKEKSNLFTCVFFHVYFSHWWKLFLLLPPRASKLQSCFLFSPSRLASLTVLVENV